MADLLSKIESLRTKPVTVRNRYAFWGALIFTLLVAVFWLTTLPARFDDTRQLQEQASAQPDPSIVGPFVRMRESVSGALGSIKEQLSALSKETTAPTSADPDLLDFEAMIASSTEVNREIEVASPDTSSSSTSTATSARSTP